jgi:hypothetical protein
MKTLIKKRGELMLAGRWDIDFHLPPEGIRQFPETLLKRVDEVASIIKSKRDPTKKPEDVFQYIDIAGIDVSTGVVVNPQELTGDEAPSRARKVVRAFDVIVSTCRPTRGAIAVVPVALHDQIASTAFSVVRAKDGINPFYLHYALRLPSTLEQFRKWSTGSSYPAILDEDVKKTRIPIPDAPTQDRIAQKIVAALHERDRAILVLNNRWSGTLDNITKMLCGHSVLDVTIPEDEEALCTLAEIHAKLAKLPPVAVDVIANGENGDLLSEIENT